MIIKVFSIILSVIGVIALILLITVAVVILLLCIPSKLKIYYKKNGEVNAVLKFLFLKLDLSDKVDAEDIEEESLENESLFKKIIKKKKSEKMTSEDVKTSAKKPEKLDGKNKINATEKSEKTADKDEDDKKSSDKKAMDYDTIVAGYGALNHVIEKLSKKAIKLLKKIKLKKIYFYLMLEGNSDDPFSTAKTYGNVNIAVYSFYGLLTNIFKVHDKSTTIILEPNFSEQDMEYSISFDAVFIPMAIVVSGLSIGVEVLKAYFKFKNILKENKNIE